MAKIFQIDEHTWRIEDDFVRFFLLEGMNKAAVIDSGVNCPNAADIAKTITNKPLLLINTHGDGDHTSGTGGFPEIYMHRSDYENYDIKTKYPATKLAEIMDGDFIELGERPLKVIHIPGHTMGSVALMDVKRRVLYAGDSVQKGHIYMFGSKRNPEQFESSLDKLIAIENEYDYIYASHDEYLLSRDYAKKVKTAWQQIKAMKTKYEMVDVHGNIVKSYTTEFCGFYLK